MFSFDAPMTVLLNTYALTHQPLLYAAVVFATDVPYILISFLIVYIFFDHKKASERGHVVFTALLAGLIARYVVKSIIVLGYAFSRPYVALQDITLLIPPILSEEHMSFPSGHMLFFFAVSAVMYTHNKTIGTTFFITSLIVGSARIMAGVHYPSDIFFGALIGTLVGFAITRTMSFYHSHAELRRRLP